MPSRDFVRFRAGQFLAILSGRCSFLCLSWWPLAKTGTKSDFAHLVFVFSAVGLLALPVVAPLADRWPRRTCVLVADLWSLLGVLVLFAITWDGIYRPLATSIVVGTLAVGVSLMTAVSGSIVPMLVPKERIGEAFAATTTSQAVVLLVAPLIASLCASWLPLGAALGANAVLLVVTARADRIYPNDSRELRAADQAGVVRQLGSGAVLGISHPSRIGVECDRCGYKRLCRSILHFGHARTRVPAVLPAGIRRGRAGCGLGRRLMVRGALREAGGGP